MGLQRLTAADLDALYSRLLTRGRGDGRGGLSARSVRYTHAIIRKALADAARKGLLMRNVARLADPPALRATRAREMATWTPAELARILQATKDHHLAALLRVAAMGGLRRGEPVGLRWQDVDLDARTATIRQTVKSIKGRVVTGRPKSEKSRRSVDLDAATVETLRAHRRRQLEQGLAIGDGWRDHDLVTCRVDGSPLHPDSVSKFFDRLVARSGLPRIRFHDLRHSHATHLIAAGKDPKLVSERLGHASVAFTLDVYTHPSRGEQADAAEAVARLVDGL